MRRLGRLRNRSGATIVLVALTLFILIGMAGIAIDFSRMYYFRAQLQTTADASAQAAALQLMKKMPTTAPDTALIYRNRNLVNNAVAVMTADSVWGGHWDDAARTFTPIISGTNPAGWTDPNINSVRVRAGYVANTSLTRVFGSASLRTTVQAIGSIGYVGNTDCLHPWAVSYQTILDVLFGKGVKTPAYNLTDADIVTLMNMKYPDNALKLLQATGDPVTPGNIAQVVVNNPWNGNNYYKGAVTQDPTLFPPNGCPNIQVGPGTWLDTDPGQGSGQTFNGLKEFCDAHGGTTGNNARFTCLGQPKVKLAMWDINNGLSGNNLKYRVKYVGVFAVVKFDKGTGGKSGQPPQIEGFFSSMPSQGSFTGTPGPITIIALVQ